jgi:hypothetical protein
MLNAVVTLMGYSGDRLSIWGNLASVMATVLSSRVVFFAPDRHEKGFRWTVC